MNLTYEQARKLGIDVDKLLASVPRKTPSLIAGLPMATDIQCGSFWWCVTIDNWRPATDNELHKSVKTEIRLKHRDRKVLRDFVAGAAQCPLAKGRRLVYLTVLKRCKPLPDPANLNKSFLDALVQTGLLKDDSREWVAPPQPNVQVSKSLPVPVRTTVHIRETTPLCTCCERGDEYNGFGSDGPRLFTCPKSCPCHD